MSCIYAERIPGGAVGYYLIGFGNAGFLKHGAYFIIALESAVLVEKIGKANVNRPRQMASLDLAIKSASVIFFIGADVYYLEAVIVGNKSVGIYHVSFINSGNGYIGRGISGSAPSL